MNIKSEKHHSIMGLIIYVVNFVADLNDVERNEDIKRVIFK